MSSAELVLRKQLDAATEQEERQLLEELMASMKTLEASAARLTNHRALHGTRLPLDTTDVALTSRAIAVFDTLVRQ